LESAIRFCSVDNDVEKYFRGILFFLSLSSKENRFFLFK
jgi:hypothetical protein